MSGSAIELLSDLIARDGRLAGTWDALEYSLIPRVPDEEIDAFCEVLSQWLEGMSPAELSEPEIREIGACSDSSSRASGIPRLAGRLGRPPIERFRTPSSRAFARRATAGLRCEPGCRTPSSTRAMRQASLTVGANPGVGHRTLVSDTVLDQRHRSDGGSRPHGLLVSDTVLSAANPRCRTPSRAAQSWCPTPL